MEQIFKAKATLTEYKLYDGQIGLFFDQTVNSIESVFIDETNLIYKDVKMFFESNKDKNIDLEISVERSVDDCEIDNKYEFISESNCCFCFIISKNPSTDMLVMQGVNILLNNDVGNYMEYKKNGNFIFKMKQL